MKDWKRTRPWKVRARSVHGRLGAAGGGGQNESAVVLLGSRSVYLHTAVRATPAVVHLTLIPPLLLLTEFQLGPGSHPRIRGT